MKKPRSDKAAIPRQRLDLRPPYFVCRTWPRLPDARRLETLKSWGRAARSSLLLCIVSALTFCAADFGNHSHLSATDFSDLKRLLGKQDAVLVANPAGRILFSKDSDKPLIPASTLKIFTALFALDCLGPDYRFTTAFYRDENANLKIKGFGDPLLISEVLAEISQVLAEKLGAIRDLILDDSYFASSLVIPGITSSYEPYDAPNGALCVNFNTVNFVRQNGRYLSAEAQTPLLPWVMQRIHKSGLERGRILLSSAKADSTLYAGHLFRYFIEQQGLKVTGRVRLGHIAEAKDRLVLEYASRFELEQIITRFLEYSNNFIANQVFIAAGIKVFGPPGTLEKSVRAAKRFAASKLKFSDLDLIEGSGISRENRISAESMLTVLEHFEPHHRLMRRQGPVFYKTGTLAGIQTRVGYIENGAGERSRFVVLLNTPGSSAARVVDKIVSGLED
jgi:D-alanyl-D-alanine carboxypeptidase/D-alanyl-D-alanine-endopeptidase (penicillin-binding protein 4)